MKTLFLLTSLVMAISACGGYGSSSSNNDDTTTVEATLSSIQTNIFTPKCATSGCHSSSTASNGLSLAEGESFGELVAIPSQDIPTVNRVTPANPGASYLINKLEGTQTSVGGAGAQMPRGGSPLDTGDIQAIKDWITAGAENN